MNLYDKTAFLDPKAPLEVPMDFTPRSRHLAMQTGAIAQRALLREHYFLRKQCGTLTEEYIERYLASTQALELACLVDSPEATSLMRKRSIASAAIINRLRRDLSKLPLSTREVDAIIEPAHTKIIQITKYADEIIKLVGGSHELPEDNGTTDES